MALICIPDETDPLQTTGALSRGSSIISTNLPSGDTPLNTSPSFSSACRIFWIELITMAMTLADLFRATIYLTTQ